MDATPGAALQFFAKQVVNKAEPDHRKASIMERNSTRSSNPPTRLAIKDLSTASDPPRFEITALPTISPTSSLSISHAVPKWRQRAMLREQTEGSFNDDRAAQLDVARSEHSRPSLDQHLEPFSDLQEVKIAGTSSHVTATSSRGLVDQEYGAPRSQPHFIGERPSSTSSSSSLPTFDLNPSLTTPHNSISLAGSECNTSSLPQQRPSTSPPSSPSPLNRSHLIRTPRRVSEDIWNAWRISSFSKRVNVSNIPLRISSAQKHTSSHESGRTTAVGQSFNMFSSSAQKDSMISDDAGQSKGESTESSASNRKKNKGLAPWLGGKKASGKGKEEEEEESKMQGSENAQEVVDLSPPFFPDLKPLPKKMEARPARVDYGQSVREMSQFINESRLAPEEAVREFVDPEPKSAFDWDSDDEESSSPRLMRGFSSPMLKSRFRSRSGNKDLKHKKSLDRDALIRAISDTLAPGTPGGSRANAFKEAEEREARMRSPSTTSITSPVSMPRLRSPSIPPPLSMSRLRSPSSPSPLSAPPMTPSLFGDPDIPPVPTLPQQYAASASTVRRPPMTAMKRESVMKMFNDPIWDREGGERPLYPFKLKVVLIIPVLAGKFRQPNPFNDPKGTENSHTKTSQGRLKASPSMPAIASEAKAHSKRMSRDDLDLFAESTRLAKAEALTRDGTSTTLGAGPDYLPSPSSSAKLQHPAFRRPSIPSSVDVDLTALPPAPPIPPKSAKRAAPQPSIHSSPAAGKASQRPSRASPVPPSQLRAAHPPPAFPVSPMHQVDPTKFSGGTTPVPSKLTPLKTTASFDNEFRPTAYAPGAANAFAGPTSPFFSSTKSTPVRVQTARSASQGGDRSTPLPTPRLPSIAEDNATTSESPSKSSPSANKGKGFTNWLKKRTSSKNIKKQADDSSPSKKNFTVMNLRDGGSVSDLATAASLSHLGVLPVPGEDHSPKVLQGPAREVSYANFSALTSMSTISATPVGLGIMEGQQSRLVREGTAATFETVSDSTASLEIDKDTKSMKVEGGDDVSDWESVADDDEASENKKTTFSRSQDDTASTFTHSEAVPPPLKVHKRRSKSKIPVMHVRRNSKFIQQENSPSFTPRRDSTFMKKVREASEEKKSKIASAGSHPAMRDASDMSGVSAALEEVRSSYSPQHDDAKSSSSATPTVVRIDSGIGMGLGVSSRDVSPLGSCESVASGSISPMGPPSPKRVGSATSVTVGAVASPSTTGTGGGVFDGISHNTRVQATRARLGMSQQRFAADGQPRHPLHPFSWDHENVMCAALHNRQLPNVELPAASTEEVVHMADVDAKYFAYHGPAERAELGQANNQQCGICGKLCCRFAELLAASKSPSGNVRDAAKRMKAKQDLGLLRSAHPQGVDLNATLMTCMECAGKVCPGCATRCMHEICQIILCKKCHGEQEGCPVHPWI